jgi:hypothetical protein
MAGARQLEWRLVIVCAHQPNFIPHLRLVEKIRQSDIFVVRDDVQFTKRNFQHRQRFPVDSEAGFRWLTVPVERRLCPIHEVRIKLGTEIKSRPWTEHHLRFFRNTYRRSKHYTGMIQEVEEIYAQPCQSLRDFNMRFFSHFSRYCEGFGTKIVFGTDLDLDAALNETDSLIEIVKRMKAKRYLSGRGALGHKNFFPKRFKEEGIELILQSDRSEPYQAAQRTVTESYGYLDKLFCVGSL